MTSTQLCACGCGQFTTISKHTRNGLVKGQPHRFLLKHHRTGGRPVLPDVSYRTVRVKGSDRWQGREYAHRVRAEKALGRPLPTTAVVHHADGSQREDAPLVICQDAAYHRLLHRRMRIKAAGGNPNTDLACSRCQLAKPSESFSLNRSTPTGHAYNCKACVRELERRAV